MTFNLPDDHLQVIVARAGWDGSVPDSSGDRLIPVDSLIDWSKVDRTLDPEPDRIINGQNHGCFGLLHTGHVTLIKPARTEGQRLVIAVNSDASTQRLKGPERPIGG